MAGPRGYIFKVLQAFCLALCLVCAASAEPQVYDIDLPAQALPEALHALSELTGVPMIFPYDLARGRQANPVIGRYALLDALEKLLEGTGLSGGLSEKGVLMISASESEASDNGGSTVDQNERKIKRANGKRSVLAGIGAFFAAVVGAPNATGQEEKAGTQIARIEEIVVTAQKREESLRDVPISISAYTPEDFDLRGIRDIADIATLTPGLNFTSRGFSNDIAIRGISGSLTGAGTTAIYIDDIPMQIRTAQPSFASGAPKIFDLERVEVLRGPQGTLFGAGAEGGAIRFITPQPSLTEYSGYARAEIADTRSGSVSHEAGIAIGGPIIEERLGFRISGWHRRDGGYIDHFSELPGGVNESDANYSDSYVGRVALALAPTNSLKVTASVFAQDVKTHDLPTWDPQFSDSDDSRFVNTELLLQPTDEKLHVPSLKIEADVDNAGFLGPVTLTSITTYLHREFNHRLDYTNVLGPFFGVPKPTSADEVSPDVHHTEQDNFIQELRLASADPAGRLQWTVGGYYAVAKQDGLQTIEGLAFPQQILDALGEPIETVFGAGLADGRFVAVIDQHNRDEQLAGFLNLEYELLNDISLIAGVRVSREDNSAEVQRRGPLFGGGQAFSGEQKETSVTPKLGVNFQPSDQHLFYASASKGYRPGGANLLNIITDTDECRAELAQVGVGLGSDLGYESDSLWSYELGSKNMFLDGRLQVSSSVFHIEWKDIQRNVGIPACLAFLVGNLGDAESQGFDLALDARLTDRLIFNLAAGYTSAEYSIDTAFGGVTYAEKGEQIAPIAPWNVTAALEYHFDISPETAGYVWLENRYNSKNDGRFPQERLSDPNFFNPESRNELNLRAGVNWGRYEVSAFATNILNDDPLLQYTLLRTNPPYGANTIRPRTFGLTGIYRF